MTTAEGRKTAESQGALPMSRETQRFVGSNLSLDGTANKKSGCCITDAAISLPRERDGWIATLQTTGRGGVF